MHTTCMQRIYMHMYALLHSNAVKAGKQAAMPLHSSFNIVQEELLGVLPDYYFLHDITAAAMRLAIYGTFILM